MAAAANAEAIKNLVVLIADGKAYTRALLRSMLLQLATVIARPGPVRLHPP